MTTKVNNRAMLVSLNITGWSARKYDRKITDEVAKNHNVKDEVGRYNKILIAKDAIQKITTLAGDARAKHYFNTLPWSDEGYRILMAVNFMDYTQIMRGLRMKWEAAVHEFVANYPSYVEDARKRLNGMFREDDYPRVDEIRRRFAFETSVLPLPEAGDFRVKLAEDEVDDIRKSIEAKVQENVEHAAADAWKRLHEAVAHMAERLDAYSKRTGEDRSGTFRDTLVTNLVDIANVLPKLNIKGDPALDQMAENVMAKLCRYDADTLRQNNKALKVVKSEADAILDAMRGIGLAA